MSLPRYPEYKDSGVEWLGEVPAHWEVRRLQDVAQVINGYPFDSRLFRQEGGYPLIRIRDLDARETATRYDGEFIREASVENGDVLIGMDGEFNVGQWLGTEKALLNQRMCCVRSPSSALTTFLRHALPIPLRAINEVTYSTTVKHLSSGDVKSIRVALPNPFELTQISEFLDHETAKIDGLLAEQEKLLALLAEKRQATISHAVTRGLDPNVPMKDSGIAWLGEVPAHWSIFPIKWATSSIEQGWSPQCESHPVDSPDEWGVMKVGCVNGGIFDPAENKKLPAELEPVPAYALKRGDLLVSRANTRDLVGSAAVVPEDHPNLLLCDKLYRMRTDHNICEPRFVAAFLGTPQARSQIELQATGASSSMLNIGQSTILDMPLPLPPISEQIEILNWLESQVLKLDETRARVEHAICLLKERRGALISAAVTGQVDVRGLS